MIRTFSFPSRLRPAALALALFAVTGFSHAQVFSTPDTDFKGSVRVTTPLVLPGNEIELAGMGFKPGQKVTLQRGESILNATPYVADAEGRFSAKLALPADAVVGVHPVLVRVSGPDAASVLDLKISRELTKSGQDHFEVTSRKVGTGLYQSAYSAKNDTLFVTSAVGRPPVTQSELLKVNPGTLEVIARITPAQAPAPATRPGQEPREDGVFAVYGVAVDDANGTVWVTNTRQDTVAVYRQSDLSLLKQYPVSAVSQARDVIVDEAHGRAYASATGKNFISVFDTKTLEQLPDIEIASSLWGKNFVPMSLELDAASGKLYTVSIGTSEIAIIDTASNTVDKVFAVPNARSASGVAFDVKNKRVLVVSQGSDNLLIVDPAEGRVVHDVYVGAGPLNVAWEPINAVAFVSNRVAGTVTAVDGEGNLVANLDGGSFPNHVHEDGKGNIFAINKARGADDATGDRVTRISMKKKHR